MKEILLTAFLLLVQLPAGPAGRLRETTEAITSGATSVDRRTAITEHLQAAGVAFQVEEFVAGTRSGTNIVATLPGKPGSKTLLLGAHYDRVARGRGAVDNAASCAVLVELAGRLKSKSLASTVIVVFFDLEERGLLGSRSYFQTHSGSPQPSQAMNFDVFAYGETFFVTPSNPDGPLLASLRQAASEFGFPVRALPMAQYPDSDHQSMTDAGIDTLGVTLIDGREVDALTMPGALPARILSLIHTDADIIEQIREQDMARALPVLERMIQLLDLRP